MDSSVCAPNQETTCQNEIPNMLRAFRAQHANLDVNQVMMLQDQLVSAMKTLRGPLSFASGCSGTDVFVYAVETLKVFYKEKYGLDFNFSHLFSAENVEFKQQFLSQHFAAPLIFQDVGNVADECAYDVLSSASKPVPRAHVWVIGFECDSFSSLSRKASANRGCVSRAEGRSGTTAQYALAYARARRPAVIIMENVKNVNMGSKLGNTDLDIVVSELNKLQYEVFWAVLKANEYGAPHARDRS